MSKLRQAQYKLMRVVFQNNVPIDGLTLAPILITVKDVMSYSKNGNKVELPTCAMRQNAHGDQVMADVANQKNTDSDKHDIDNNIDEPAKGLHKPAKATQEFAVDFIVSYIGKARNVE